MTILVTGAAGFIGAHLVKALLARGEHVVGIDNLNDYYPVTLKHARLDTLIGNHPAFNFVAGDLADQAALDAAVAGRSVSRIVHLGAQAGVRYSIENPRAYAHSNLVGQLEILELARTLKVRHLVYASSSSVYGSNAKLPFAVGDTVDHPVSLYAATKRADELMSDAYAHLFTIPQTGLRFFTVYGPWGRPDMAPWLFTEAILRGQPIRLFNGGRMKRDFTYIDDIVAGVLAALDRPPAGTRPHFIYNLGNDRAEELTHFVQIIEAATGRRAIVEEALLPPGDVIATHADIDRTRHNLEWSPTTTLDDGLPRFVDWFRGYLGL